MLLHRHLTGQWLEERFFVCEVPRQAEELGSSIQDFNEVTSADIEEQKEPSHFPVILCQRETSDQDSNLSELLADWRSPHTRLGEV